MKASEGNAEKENFLQVAEDAGRRSPHSGLSFQFLSNLPEKELKHSSSLIVYDAFVTLAGVSLFYVAFWRGSFGVLFYSLNVNQMYLLSFIGAMMNVYFAITRDIYDVYLIQKTWPYAVLGVIYMYTVEMGLIFQWAGLWFLMEYFINLRVSVLAWSSGASVVALLILSSSVNLLTTPFRVFCTNRKFMRRLKSSIQSKRSKVDSLFVLDTLFSVFVVGSLVVFAWRGVWCLFDIYLYPDDEVLSALTSLIVGYAIVLIVFGLQSPMKKCCEALTGFWRLAVLDLYIFFSFMGTINVWRGIWNLLNIYLLPDSLPLSCWITHFAGFAFLVLINCSNSILVRGVAVDGEEEGGKCVIFPISYLRTIFSGGEKKESSEQEEVSKNKNDVTV